MVVTEVTEHMWLNGGFPNKAKQAVWECVAAAVNEVEKLKPKKTNKTNNQNKQRSAANSSHLKLIIHITSHCL